MRNELIVESLRMNLRRKITQANELQKSIKLKEESGLEEYLIPIHKEKIEKKRADIKELESLLEEYQ